MSTKSKRHLHTVKEQMPPHARESLLARGINDELIASSGLYYATADEAQALVGKPLDGGGPSDGIVIPYLSGKVVVRWLREGIEPKYRYKAPTGSAPEFYLTRSVSWHPIARDTDYVIYLTEGEFKAIAGCAAKIPTISLSGVWGWSRDHEPIADFGDFEWKGREVYLCFDSDVVTKPSVQMALSALAKYLASLGAIVYVKVLPSEPDGSKNGMDDYLKRYGAEAFERVPAIPITDPMFADWGAHPATRQLNEALTFIPIGGKDTVLVESSHPDFPGAQVFDLVKPNDLKAQYLNQRHEVGKNAKGVPIVKTAYEIWLADKGRRDAARITFAPDKIPGLDRNTRTFNLFQGLGTVPIAPDRRHSWLRLQEHIHEVCANGNDAHANYIIDWMAWGIQHLGERPEAALAFLGGEGTGKGIVFRAYTHLYGPHGLQLFQPKQLTGGFNRHLQDKMAIFADEAFFAGDHETANALKGMITEPTRFVEPKFCDGYAVPNFTRLMVASNEHWVLRTGADARRFAVFEMSEKRTGNLEYFAAIGNQLKVGGYAAMLYDLQHRDLSRFDPRQLPKTSALFDQKRQSFDAITDCWYLWLLDGRLPPLLREKLGATEGWPEAVPRVRVRETIADAITGTYEKRALETRIGIVLRKLCPGIRDERRTYAGAQERHYVLPPLTECRKAFETYVGTEIDWDSGSGRAAGGTKAT